MGVLEEVGIVEAVGREALTLVGGAHTQYHEIGITGGLTDGGKDRLSREA